MSGVTVATGWHPAALQEYAQTFMETFARHWPAEIRLVAYTEEPVTLPRGECRSLWDIDGARSFYERHRNITAHCGAAPVPAWRAKDRRRGSAWRWDAVRFFKQCMIPEEASLDMPDGDILVWLDADVVTFGDVPSGFVEKILGKADLCYLGRNKGAEIGFWVVRLSERSRWFLAELAGLYREDRVFTLQQWHSAFAFDHARRGSGLEQLDLTPGGRDHVWMQSPLARYTDHLKGGRKAMGHSPEHPIKWWERTG